VSGDLHITFAADLPTMAVEVVAPDLSIVKRMMMRGSQQATVNVPSEASFVRVYLPSGRAVTLNDPGNLSRTITRDAIELNPQRTAEWLGSTTVAPPPSAAPSTTTTSPTTGPSLKTRRDVRRYQVWRASTPQIKQREDQELPLGDSATARVVEADGHPRTGTQGVQLNEILWDLGGPSFERPFDLTIKQNDGRELRVRLPGNVNRLWARVDRLEVEKSLNYSLRAESEVAIADTILNYLCRGDFAAAAAMAEWADESEQLLMSKMSDPYAAAVGAYLLLKLQRFDQLRDWTRNLANSFSFLSDGCVLWASQLIQQSPDKEHEIRKYLMLATERGLPVYTSGLRLLFDGLRLIGDDGDAAAEKLRHELGQVIWESPLTARMTAPPGSRTLSKDAITFDIEFGSTT
jgi:hypothetical protein